MESFFAPLGSVLANNADVFFFDMNLGLRPKFRIEGSKILKVETYKQNYFVAYRLKLDTKGKKKIKLFAKSALSLDIVEQTYQVVSRPTQKRPTLVLKNIRREDTRTGCSYTKATSFEVDAKEAVAFRVDWAKTKAEFQTSRKSFYLPAFTHLFYPTFRDKSSISYLKKGKQTIKLGHLNCLGYNFQWKKHKKVYIGVVAIYPDGSESKQAAKPYELKAP